MQLTGVKRILVTGGAGFVGTALCKAWLAQDASVLALDDFSAKNKGLLSFEEPSLRVVTGTVQNSSLVRQVIADFQPHVVYHLAAIHYIPACEADPLRALEINVQGTASVLLASRDAGVQQVFLASTSSVYADSAQPYDESYPTGPRDIYGLTKLFAESLCHYFHSLTGTTTTICRFFNVYGPGDTIPHIIPEILKQLVRTGDTLQLGSLTPRRDFVAVSDIVDALMALTNVRKGSLEVFNIGSGQDYTIEEVVHLMETALGARIKVITDQSRVRAFERPRLAANISKIRNEIGWKPKTSLPDGLAATILAFPGMEGRPVRVASNES